MFVAKELTVESLLKTYDFRDVKVLAGHTGLTNVVTWPHILEVIDDADYFVDGGELVFAGSAANGSNASLAAFFHKLINKEISALCIQLGVHPDDVPREMIDLADEYQCPLLGADRSIRYLDLTHSVIHSINRYDLEGFAHEKAFIESNYWVLDWIHEELSEDQIAEHLQKKKLHYHYFALAIEYRRHALAYQWSENTYTIISKRLREVFEHYHFTLLPFFLDNLFAAVVLDFGSSEDWRARFNHALDAFNALPTQKDKPSLIIACGMRSLSSQDISLSYQSAKGTLSVCQRFNTNRSIYEDLGPLSLLHLASDSTDLPGLKRLLVNPIAPLRDFDTEHNGKLLLTLKTYYDFNGNKQQTARALSITRRSLYYRLEKIEVLLGTTDLLKPKKRQSLELSLAFFALVNNSLDCSSPFVCPSR